MPGDRCILKKGRYAVDMSSRTRPDNAGLAAWLTLLQARSTVMDAVEDDLQRGVGLPLAWFEVLLQVASAPDGRLKMQDLAHSVLLSKSGITRLVDRMVEGGMLTRDAHATDRRIVYATATAKGRAALREALPIHAESLDRHFASVLTPAELRMITATLTKVLDAAGFVPAACPSGVIAESEKRSRSRAS
jgi:DNA-binding MarR family transcriptional regulator